FAGLVRYRLDDVVRVHGRIGQTPIVEFLHRAGRVSSIAGEKLTENQVVSAMQAACKRLAIREFDFVAAPMWGDPPCYRISAVGLLTKVPLAAIEEEISAQNDEYKSRRKSGRFGPVGSRPVPEGAFQLMDSRLISARRSNAEQYKRPCL